jgi:hypothetical protein
MDVSDASYYIHPNIKNKGSQMGQTKKILEKRPALENRTCLN